MTDELIPPVTPQEIQRSPSIINLAKALTAVQKEMKPAAKDADNPFFKSKYADLASVWDACRKELTGNGLSVAQFANAKAQQVIVTTMLIHISGEFLSSELTVTARENTPQAIGSAITYARRYGMSALVGVCAEDDDGAAASGNPAAGKTTGAPAQKTTAATGPAKGPDKPPATAPAKAAAPPATGTTVKPDPTLRGILGALEAVTGEIISVKGMVVSFTTRKAGKGNVSDFVIGDFEETDQEVVISMFGTPPAYIVRDTWVVFEDVIVKEYKGKKEYLAAKAKMVKGEQQ